jgi:hypothetical protein
MLGLPINNNQAKSLPLQRENDINGNAVYYYQFKKEYRINSFLMQELKLYMA